MAIVGEADVSRPTPGGNRQLAIGPSVGVGCCEVLRIDSSDYGTEQKHKLLEMVEVFGLLDTEQEECVRNFQIDHHEAFCIDPEEQGETDLVQLEVDAGDAAPRRQPVHRMPFAVRQEIAR